MPTKCYRIFILLIAAFVFTQCGRVSTTASSYSTPPARSLSPTQAGAVSANNVAMPAKTSADFAFEFAFGACGTDVLDTFAATYTKDMLVAEPITISLTLSSDEQNRIYAKMRDINIFAYPAVFSIDTTNAAEIGQVTPAMTYSFSIRNAGQTHAVKWVDNITKPTAPEADRLRELAQLIMTTIEQQPKVQQLPQPQAGCA